MKKIRDDNMVLIVAGNKADLPTKRVTKDQAQSFANSHNIQFFEVSAKTGDNVQDLFKLLAENIAQKLPTNNS